VTDPDSEQVWLTLGEATPLDGDRLVIAASGVIGLDTAQQLERELAGQIEQGHSKVVLDVTRVPLVDSAGISALLRIHRQAGRQGGWLRLAHPQPRIRRAFVTTNLDRLVTLHDSIEEALR
jgi:anti-anti-sigma factor